MMPSFLHDVHQDWVKRSQGTLTIHCEDACGLSTAEWTTSYGHMYLLFSCRGIYKGSLTMLCNSLGAQQSFSAMKDYLVLNI